jgi:lipopolysaccharide export system permease protein
MTASLGEHGIAQRGQSGKCVGASSPRQTVQRSGWPAVASQAVSQQAQLGGKKRSVVASAEPASQRGQPRGRLPSVWTASADTASTCRAFAVDRDLRRRLSYPVRNGNVEWQRRGNGLSMTVIDRYLVTLFTKVLIVCFVSLFGLFVVIDGFTNLNEFTSLGGSLVGTLQALVEYYGPRALQFFDKVTGLLAMTAVVFAITWLQRTSEMTALLAGGISPARVVLPLLLAAGVVAGLGAANREFGLPLVRDSLTRDAKDLLGQKTRKCTPRYDLRSDVLISGDATIAENRRIKDPKFRLPPELWDWGRQIVAANAYHQRATSGRPAGYLLKGVTQPPNLPQLRSMSLNGNKVLLSPADEPGLAADECFVVSVVTFEQLAVGSGWRRFLSSYELITGLKQQSIEPGADVWVMLHSRLLQPLLDLSLVLLGLPLVLGRQQRNIFLAAGLCAAVMALVYLVVLTCHGLGSNYLLDPTLATWIPLVVFGPLAYALARPLWD